jgi:hypothetical protein
VYSPDHGTEDDEQEGTQDCRHESISLCFGYHDVSFIRGVPVGDTVLVAVAISAMIDVHSEPGSRSRGNITVADRNGNAI